MKSPRCYCWKCGEFVFEEYEDEFGNVECEECSLEEEEQEIIII